MNTRRRPEEIAEAIATRSICSVQVGSVIVGKGNRIPSWGWNHAHKGFGLCAERFAISRANKARLAGATIYVAAFRKRHGGPVTSRPCELCQASIKKVGIVRVIWRDGKGNWIEEGV